MSVPNFDSGLSEQRVFPTFSCMTTRVQQAPASLFVPACAKVESHFPVGTNGRT